jgi:AsmA protein
MRRIAFGFLGILGVLFGIALILPFFLNVNDYKPQIVAKAKETLGRDVYIDGKLSLSLLPSPKFSIGQISIGNRGTPQNGSLKDPVRIKNLTVSIDLLPLLKKKIKINTIDLYSPEIFLENFSDGRVNWAGALLAPPPPDKPSSPSSPNFEVALDKVLVHNGQIAYHEKGKDFDIQEINLSTQLGSLQGPYKISGTLKALGRQVIIDTNLGALGESQEASHEKTQDVALKVQIGEATSMLEGKASLSSLTFKGNLKASATPKAFMKNRPQEKEPPLLSKPLHLDATVVANTATISLNPINLEIGSARPSGALKVTLKDTLRVDGNVNNLPGIKQCAFTLSPSSEGLSGSVRTTITQGKKFLDWLDIETKTMPPALMGSLSLSTNYILGDMVRLKNLSLMIQDAKLQGSASWQSPKGVPLVAVDFESPKIENIFKLLGAKDPKPLGVGKFKANIQWNATSFHLAHLKGQLGAKLSFAGDVAIDHATVKPKVKAALSFNSINVDTLLASRQIENSCYPPDGREGKIFLISAHASHWSSAPLDFSFLDKFDGQLEINASQLHLKDFLISSPKLVATIQNGRLNMSALTGSIFGGSLIGNGSFTSDNALHFQVALKEANLKNLPTQKSHIKIVGGNLFFSSNLSTHGESAQAMIRNLHGPVNITAKNGVINGFDLHTISQRLENLQNPASLLGLLTTSMGQGQTPFSSFKGDIIFKDGVGTIQSMHLVAQDGQGQASGQIDLPHYLLNIQAQFQLTEHPKIPPFHMHLSGAIDNPSRQLDTSALQRYMMENVFKGALEKLGKLKPNNLLESTLGSDKGSSLDKPGKIVKDIFKGIF